MQDVNSINQLSNLKKSLEMEDRQIKIIESDIHRRQDEHRRAKERFEKLDKELLDLNKKKDDLINRREQINGEVKQIQRSLDEYNKHSSSSSLKL